MLFKSLLLAALAFAFPLTIEFGDFSGVKSQVGLMAPGEKPIPGDSPVAVCDIYEPKLLTLDEVTISPNPPEKGANLSFAATGLLSKPIEEGLYVVVLVRYGYIKLLEKTFDLCEELVNVDMTCPIAEGPQAIAKTVEIPDEVPPGKYTVYARAFTPDDDYITCLTASVTFQVEGYSLGKMMTFGKRWLMGEY